MFNNAIAMREGWAISQCIGLTEDWRLERLDEAGIFESDIEAWQHVRFLANNGSAYHKDALRFLYERSRSEYENIMA